MANTISDPKFNPTDLTLPIPRSISLTLAPTAAGSAGCLAFAAIALPGHGQQRLLHLPRVGIHASAPIGGAGILLPPRMGRHGKDPRAFPPPPAQSDACPGHERSAEHHIICEKWCDIPKARHDPSQSPGGERAQKGTAPRLTSAEMRPILCPCHRICCRLRRCCCACPHPAPSSSIPSAAPGRTPWKCATAPASHWMSRRPGCSAGYREHCRSIGRKPAEQPAPMPMPPSAPAASIPSLWWAAKTASTGHCCMSSLLSTTRGIQSDSQVRYALDKRGIIGNDEQSRRANIVQS